jgi:hypothetical protein
MSAVVTPRRRWVAVLAAAIASAAFIVPVQADNVSVNVDEARVMRLPGNVATVVIGNPLIADASLQAGGVLVITGKSYGSTNLMALDRNGKILMDQNLVVASPSPAIPGLVVVYKGIERESYSCSPECAPRIMLGDSNAYFSATMSQSSTRTGGGGGGGGQAAPPAR